MKYLGHFLLLLLATVFLLVLQYQYWLGESGHADSLELKQQIEYQADLNANQTQINRVLKADVKDLKTGLEAVEEHARLDLGLIKPGETFVQMSTATNSRHNSANDHLVGESATTDTQESIPEPLGE